MLFSVGIPPSPGDWGEPPKSLPAVGDDVHLWRVTLNGLGAAQVAELAQTLGDEEAVRAKSFRRGLHRDRYVVGRASLRAILALYVACRPQAVTFAYGAWGKPFLAGGAGPHFNVSHCEDLALIAVRARGQVGIDVERVDRPVGHWMTALDRFSPEDAQAVAAAPLNARAEMFFRVWTRGEAVLKALGIGVSGLKRDRGKKGADCPYAVHEFVPAAGFIACLALSRSCRNTPSRLT